MLWRAPHCPFKEWAVSLYCLGNPHLEVELGPKSISLHAIRTGPIPFLISDVGLHTKLSTHQMSSPGNEGCVKSPTSSHFFSWVSKGRSGKNWPQHLLGLLYESLLYPFQLNPFHPKIKKNMALLSSLLFPLTCKVKKKTKKIPSKYWI